MSKENTPHPPSHESQNSLQHKLKSIFDQALEDEANRFKKYIDENEKRIEEYTKQFKTQMCLPDFRDDIKYKKDLADEIVKRINGYKGFAYLISEQHDIRKTYYLWIDWSHFLKKN